MQNLTENPALNAKIVGRYALFDEIAAGGMATVHIGRMLGPVGFSRTVAVKRLHPQFAKDPDFVSMFVDEARLASRIQHPNVVTTIDVVQDDDELLLVMEYVVGESLSKLVRNASRRGDTIPPDIAVSMMSGMLYGLHAAHEANSEQREPLNIVHRDISPQNVLIGVDGVARVLDFGVAKAAMRSQSTRDGEMKGKLSYMSPEQLNGQEVDRRSDIFAAGIVCWEALCGRRLFAGHDAGEILAKVLSREIRTPREVVEERSGEDAARISEALSQAVMRALERRPDKRFQTAREFAIALESSGPIATARQVGEWVSQLAGPAVEERRNNVANVEKLSMSLEEFRDSEPPRDSRPGFARDSRPGVARDSRPGATAALEPAVDESTMVDKPDHAGARDQVEFSALEGSRRRRGAVPLAGALLLLGGGLLLWLPMGAGSPGAQALGELGQPRPTDSPRAMAQPAVPGDAGESRKVRLGRPPGLAQPDSGAAPNAGQSLPGARAKPKRRPVKRSCSPPYRVDSRGIRRPKEWCL